MDDAQPCMLTMDLSSTLLLLVFHSVLPLPPAEDNQGDKDNASNFYLPCVCGDTAVRVEELLRRIVLTQWQLWSSLSSMDDDLGFWVKHCSTAWFSRFLMEEYENDRWINFFRMTKPAFLALARLLSPYMCRQNTNYRSAVPVTVRVGCALFKLCHRARLLLCSELFAVGQSTVNVIFRQFVATVNTALRSQISWPAADSVRTTAAAFECVCGLSGVVGAIDVTHFAIKKPSFVVHDYYHFKLGGYSISCHAVVDSSKRFLDLYVGMPGFTNDACVLRRSTLYRRGQRNTLWSGHQVFSSFSPYLLGDVGYPLLLWLMVPVRRTPYMSMSASLLNSKLGQGRVVVENAFSQLKTTFKELQQRTNLHVVFLPDIIVACVILHNVLLQTSHEDVVNILQALSTHSVEDQADREFHPVQPVVAREDATFKHHLLGVRLIRSRARAKRFPEFRHAQCLTVDSSLDEVHGVPS